MREGFVPNPRSLGGFKDIRTEDWISRDLEDEEASMYTLRERWELMQLEIRLGRRRDIDQALSDEIARLDNDIAFDRKRLRAFAQQHEAEERARGELARITELRAALGGPPPASTSPVTVEDTRDVMHKAEYDALLASHAARSPVFDPNSKEGKARLKAEQDERDPFKKGGEAIDAIHVLAGRVDAPKRR